ncbi:unnamed protein product [Rotaria sp. Silwood1]|nr:unnamed protein product [Rotaria sp. Silwood1]
MFTTTNVAGTAGSAGGPVAAAVLPTYQLISTPVNGSSSTSSSSTNPPIYQLISTPINGSSSTISSPTNSLTWRLPSTLTSSSLTNPPTYQLISTPDNGSSSSSSTNTSTWRLPSTLTSSIIKQPSVVSIINGNMNVTSSTTVPMNSTGVTMPTHGNILYIATTNSQQHNPITTGNLILQSPQTVRLVSTPLHTSLSAPALTLLNNSNTTIINNPRQIITPSSSSSSNNFKPGICIDTPILGRLAPITIERQNYLFQATKVFNIEQNQTNKNWTWYWWTMRTVFTHQKMLEERSMTLCNHAQMCIDKLLTYQSEMNKVQQILFFIEITYISEYYYNWKQVDTAKKQALEISGLEINLTGQLGKRTRYQINNTSQLLLDITRKEAQQTLTNNNMTNEENLILPKNLALNDDVVLNQIQFQNETDYQNLTIQLNIIEQLTLLLIIYHRQINHPSHEITTEEQLAFLTVCIQSFIMNF